LILHHVPVRINVGQGKGRPRVKDLKGEKKEEKCAGRSAKALRWRPTLPERILSWRGKLRLAGKTEHNNTTEVKLKKEGKRKEV